MSFWKDRRVLITGGASFIGSHLADSLIASGAKVRIVDDLSSGRLENIQSHMAAGAVEFIQADLREPGITRAAVHGIEHVFHLAADHGGRGYVDLHQAGPATNFFLDGLVFWEARRAGVKKITFASSGCVYPNHLQCDPTQELYLTEDLVKAPHDADNLYGWAKLMGELSLKAYAKEYGIQTASCRFFTVYGPRGVENHAVIAMIAKAFIGQNPFEVWGDGEQIRNWTFVEDIVSGMILAAEKISDGTAVNLGTMERIRVLDAVKMVMDYLGHKAPIKLLKNMPTGPVNRVADNALAHKLMGWKPATCFEAGLRRTMDWYLKTKDRTQVKQILGRMLTER